MVALPQGKYRRGSPRNEQARDDDEGPMREVSIGYHLAFGKFEVTFDDWNACVADKQCKSRSGEAKWRGGKRPIIEVSWDDIVEKYLPWLNGKLNLSGASAYRLPTEAEWEYAARAGATTRYSWGDDIGRGNANCYNCGSRWDNKQSAPVGSFEPNKFGLHDMHGNVREWVADCHSDSYAKTPTDGSKGRDTSNCSRVLRGGSWTNNPRNLRAAFRDRNLPDNRSLFSGFRLVRTLKPKS
ncbi:MAG: formylglycine-generating enzyme family protein [Hyphomicrobiaceae bacterium]|nr:formylglycine-generating enzyme family protein [Hyphomicrobiaceae bacterium]